MTANQSPADAVREAPLIAWLREESRRVKSIGIDSTADRLFDAAEMLAALTARVAEQTVQRDGWHRRVHELEAQLLEWLHANGPGGWIDDLRQRAKDADVAETKLTAINGLARIANAAIKERP